MKTGAAIALAALAAAVVAGSSGAAHGKRTIAYVSGCANGDRIQSVSRGGRAAAKALGIRFIVAGTPCSGSVPAVTEALKSMIARHPDAVATDGYVPGLKPVLTRVRKARILLVSSGDDIAATRDVWVNESDPDTYGRALADALAAQIQGNGEYAILEQRDQYPIATAWEKVVASYVTQAYPGMTLDGVLDGTGAGDEAEVDSVKSFMSSHPKLKGFIAVTPTETYMAAEAIQQAGLIGRVFSSGNGGGSFDDLLPGFVRSGVAEVVFVGDPTRLGYLTVWAANYLLTGHHFRPGAYQVGGPIGLVYYYAKHQELRLGRPLTITKTNVDLYANTF